MSPEEPARSTLRRQFPTLRGRGPAAVVALFDRLGPVQSQVPRTPFLTAAGRLPGVEHRVVEAVLADHRLVKASTLRGTVHVSTPALHRAQVAACTGIRTAEVIRQTGLGRARIEALWDALLEHCAETWRTRDEVVTRAREVIGPDVPLPPEVYLWGHPALWRKPSDDVWERRTDVLRRTAPGLEPDSPHAPDRARAELVRVHLRAYGPATRRDIAWWLGDRVTAVDRAVTALGSELEARPGPGADPLLDLADPPVGGRADPGVVLLPEFDGLLLGFHPENRHRFLDSRHLPLIWNRANGLFQPLVLAGGRIAARWRTERPGRRTMIAVTVLPGMPVLTQAQLAEPVAAAAAALRLEVIDVRITAHR